MLGKASQTSSGSWVAGAAQRLAESAGQKTGTTNRIDLVEREFGGLGGEIHFKLEKAGALEKGGRLLS